MLTRKLLIAGAVLSMSGVFADSALPTEDPGHTPYQEPEQYFEDLADLRNDYSRCYVREDSSSSTGYTAYFALTGLGFGQTAIEADEALMNVCNYASQMQQAN